MGTAAAGPAGSSAAPSAASLAGSGGAAAAGAGGRAKKAPIDRCVAGCGAASCAAAGCGAAFRWRCLAFFSRARLRFRASSGSVTWLPASWGSKSMSDASGSTSDSDLLCSKSESFSSSLQQSRWRFGCAALIALKFAPRLLGLGAMLAGAGSTHEAAAERRDGVTSGPANDSRAIAQGIEQGIHYLWADGHGPGANDRTKMAPAKRALSALGHV
mmetsp:Transcript_51944/g.153269  ORF Transcript_51944/g.153269 Transcript_51944/m.153269 type:complete len:215 (+) Transcript_51944:242-886(+)